MATTKTIKNIKIIKSGSNPDVDSDFHTLVREDVLEYVTDLYGKNNVSNIVTFGTLAAKGAVKAMCTIYNIPFSQANKLASLVPPAVEGKECTLEDIYNPDSDRYAEASEFRSFASGSDWERIIQGAINIEGKNKSTGVHACGIIISSEPLQDVIPLHVRQNDQRVITQWTYKECESLGLIKMDFLGLDTVDLIQNTINYIMASGKTPPNMLDLIHGKMDDPKVYKLFQDSHTTGIFQFGSEMVRNLLKLVKPTEFDDLAATTAVARPGPMGMKSHIKYADRKNGREEIDFIHPEFVGSPLEEILSKTYGLIVYQESIIKIASEIAGMTLQEGDDLRSAMGKKKMDVMRSMKPKFFSGTMENGYSEEATKVLWDTIEEFAKYGFNKSHSVAYAMNSYQSAYLKTYYPVEFMAALIEQNVDDKKKTLEYLREAKRMGLKVGTVDINLSDIKVSPDYENGSNNDILFGISGVKAVSEDIAKIIVKERKKNGVYESVQDMINRCIPLGVSTRSIYENLAKAGAFDLMGVSRKAIVESISDLMGDAKSKTAKGESLFDMFSVEDDPSEVDLTGEEYDYVTKLQEEANMVGLYLTGNPLDNLGPGGSKMRSTNVSKILKSNKRITTTILGSAIKVDVKQRRQGKSITVDIDDGTDYMSAILAKDVVKGIDKYNAQENVRKLYQKGENEISKENREIAVDPTFEPIKGIEENNVYIMNITYSPGRGDNPYNAKVNWIKPLNLTHDGKLPVRIRFKATKDNLDKMKKLYKALPANLAKKLPGDYPIHVSMHTKLKKDSHTLDNMYMAALQDMDNDAKNGVNLRMLNDAKIQDQSDKNTQHSLMGNTSSSSAKKKKKSKIQEPGDLRAWPPESFDKSKNQSIEALTVEDITDAIESLNYIDTGLTCAKTQKVELAIEKFLGIESYDFGIFDSSILTD